MQKRIKDGGKNYNFGKKIKNTKIKIIMRSLILGIANYSMFYF